ncbi:MAG: VWA domain-containing protein [Acidobacteriota bacterium]
MTRRQVWFARMVLFLILVIASQSLVRADDFGMIVGKIEKHYGAKKKKIPFLGLAGFAVKLIRPAGVKSFKVAIFEDQDFAPGQRDRGFEQAVASSLKEKWTPTVRSNDRVSGNRSYVYTHQSGKDLEMLTLTFSGRQAIVAQAKINPEAVSKFIDKPQLMGISLGGGSKGAPSILDPSSNIYSGGSANWSGGSGDSSLDSLRDASAPATDPGLKSKPVLGRSADDSVSEPAEAESRELAREKPDPDAIHLEARLINLNVKATDRSGSSLAALKKEDFRVFEDGVEQSIFSFEPVSAPINLVLLLDLSGSTRESRNVMLETAKTFIDSLGARDQIAVAAFTRKFILASDFTADKKVLKKSVEKMKKVEGGTAFYDAMWSTLDLLRRVKDSRKAIVVLTDGVDESLLDSDDAAIHSFDELLARVAEEDATIYPIYLNTEEARLLDILKDPMSSESRRERAERRLKPNKIAHRQIDMLAEESAGTVFVAEGANDLDNVYQRVAAELRLIYTLAYAPKNTTRDGKFKNIGVSVAREGAIVKTRRGYLAR